MQADIENLKAAAAAVIRRPREPRLPRRHLGLLPNRYYASQEEYLGVLAEAMREEYEAIYRAGLVLQVIAPTWP